MISEINKELSSLEVIPKTLRNFGALFFAVFGIAAGTMFWNGNLNGKWPAVISLAFLAAGIFFPGALRHPYRLWMLLALVMGWFMTRIVLVAAFWLIMTPSGWLLRAIGKDLLDEKIQKESPTYWKKHDRVCDKERYKKQF